MKNYQYSILAILFCLFFISGASAATTSPIDLNKSLRIGLVELNKYVDSITVGNKSLVLGYEINGSWNPEFEMMSSTGFIITPATNFYLISTQTFSTFMDSEIKVGVLREQGFNAFSGNASPGIWKVYVGSYATDVEAGAQKTTLEATPDLAYEVVADNGLRTLLSYVEGSSVILENSYVQASFGTNDVTNSVNLIQLGKRSYRGKMEFGRYNKKGLTAINVVGLEDYLYGVVPAEMPSSWPIEALKAQAVAARNYAVSNAIIGKKYTSEAYAIDDTVNNQVYKGYGAETPAGNEAVNQTYGKLICFGDSVISALYFSTSGGHTEDSQNVWEGPAPYYKGVPDIYETEPERKPWVKSLTSAEIEAVLTKNKVNIGSLIDVEVSSYTEAGRVMGLKFTGTLGNHEIPKETIRRWLGLDSRKFTLVKSNYIPQQNWATLSANGVTGYVNYTTAYAINGSLNPMPINTGKDQLIVFSSQNIYDLPMISGKADTYIFVGEGYGHGIGLSQSGAKGMAKAGFTYQQILEYYFKGTVVK